MKVWIIVAVMVLLSWALWIVHGDTDVCSAQLPHAIGTVMPIAGCRNSTR